MRCLAAVTALAAGLLAACGESSGPVEVLPAIRVVSGDNQTDTVGQALGQAFVVEVTGANAQPSAGIVVTFAVVGGGGALSAAADTTEAGGLASTVLTLGTVAGSNTVTATGSGLSGSPVTFRTVAVPDAPAALDKISVDGQNGFTSRAILDSPVVRVRDQFQNAVPGISVGWAVTGGGGTVAAPATTTNSSGLATVSWTLGVTAGANGLEAVVAGLPAVTFSATGIWPGTGRIAFASDRNGNPDIYVMNSDGSGLVQLTNNLADDGQPTWSPDASKIAFVSTRNGGGLEIYVMNADGTAVVRLTDQLDTDASPAWSPDGSRIAFSSARDAMTVVDLNIYVMNADGSGVRRLTTDPKLDGSPTWSPDGSKIAFMTSRHATNEGNSEIYVVNADGTGETRLTYFPYDDKEPVWSTDGSKIYWVSIQDNTGPHIWVMNADGTGTTRFTNDPSADGLSAFSPDGLKIVFSRSGEIYSMNADGTGVMRLTNHPAQDFSPAWGR
jgi:TolB protein